MVSVLTLCSNNTSSNPAEIVFRKNIITKEQQDKEKKQFEQFELKDPYSEEYKGE